jgi:AraC-like DNA-binding protein
VSINDIAAECKLESASHINSGDWQNTSRRNKTQGNPSKDKSLHSTRFIKEELGVTPVVNGILGASRDWIFVSLLCD